MFNSIIILTLWQKLGICWKTSWSMNWSMAFSTFCFLSWGIVFYIGHFHQSGYARRPQRCIYILLHMFWSTLFFKMAKWLFCDYVYTIWCIICLLLFKLFLLNIDADIVSKGHLFNLGFILLFNFSLIND